MDLVSRPEAVQAWQSVKVPSGTALPAPMLPSAINARNPCTNARKSLRTPPDKSPERLASVASSLRIAPRPVVRRRVATARGVSVTHSLRCPSFSCHLARPLAYPLIGPSLTRLLALGWAMWKRGRGGGGGVWIGGVT